MTASGAPGRRVAVVTGASSGIGRALALELATADGYAVGLLARRMDALRTLEAEVQTRGGRARAVSCDVADREAVHRALEAVVQAFGPVDLLVANAGTSLGTPALALDAASVETEFRVNVFGPVYAFEAVLPSMQERGHGHIVAISSLAGRRGFKGSGGYCATKAALTRLMESLRLEWHAVGIRTTTVHPGFVDTEIFTHPGQKRPFQMGPERAAKKIARAIRRGRTTYDFPWPTALLGRLAPLIPDALLRRRG